MKRAEDLYPEVDDFPRYISQTDSYMDKAAAYEFLSARIISDPHDWMEQRGVGGLHSKLEEIAAVIERDLSIKCRIVEQPANQVEWKELGLRALTRHMDEVMRVYTQNPAAVWMVRSLKEVESGT